MCFCSVLAKGGASRKQWDPDSFQTQKVGLDLVWIGKYFNELSAPALKFELSVVLVFRGGPPGSFWAIWGAKGSPKGRQCDTCTFWMVLGRHVEK